MTGLIVYKIECFGGITSQLREFRNIPDEEAKRLKTELEAKKFVVFDFKEK